ncbi:heparan-alpha-glucosaminide N-acetyltransferase-like isoform X1 [Entelurus aequoreus]|uniref:heparan-alpha-glucosaminide N-acetyltransferase-like isoform X1 n=3 Tax=Entelurus aequoreus TaxID=161455 RepID=UPI002B1E4875|nr:heparan-alpha-glucosaminide N-acetyltransferase-like isoform X1 [Entelurus aequoreus]XP_061914686.1 heparan-alpha-glucosaminide N-acetyltransferase-like isoform X1 [Entelurus aequoreus]XP_061914687.1 heparan-alpha-glucosaminide N-acetyltransferase-like isoform X1 [Entelurus aequoreus]
MEPVRLVRAVLTLVVISTSLCGANVAAGPTLKMDQALLMFYNQLPHDVEVLYTSDYCYKCMYQRLIQVKANHKNVSAVISTKFTLSMRVESHKGIETLCRWSETYEEGGHYCIWIGKSVNGNNVSCIPFVDRRPNNSYTPILVAALSLSITALLFVVTPYAYRKWRTSKFMKTICCQIPQYSLDEVHVGNAESSASKVKPTRLRSLDTFRGFALTVMVFVNYGGGGYWFFQHVPWNGLTVADLVMPWFVFAIGTSVVLAIRSMQRRGVGRLQLLRKVTWRTLVLLMLGFCFLNYSPRDGPLSWSWLRIPGVLQRLAFTYFVLALLQTLWGNKDNGQSEGHWWSPVQDVVLYRSQWLIIILLETLWLCITFLLPVPNCPTGYLGAGGIGDNGLYPNCTGGAAGYIDKWMFGDNMYRYPTCKGMYRSTQPFDPEGILGTINSIVMGFMGMQAGKIIIFYKGKNVQILCRFLVWAIVLGISAAILSKCTRDEGFIPVNKNLWSLSYVTCMGCFSFLLLGGVYFICDVKGWWGGQPFIYPGMNSIFVYVGHSLLGFYFPFSWEMRFQESHWELLFQSLWGTALWLIIAYLLYRKKFFLKI